MENPNNNDDDHRESPLETFTRLLRTDAWQLALEFVQSPRVDVNFRNQHGVSMLHRLAELPIIDLTETIGDALITRGALVDHQDIDGNTPMHYACMRTHDWGYVNVFFLLLHGASARMQNSAGRTPFFVACEYGLLTVAGMARGTCGQVNDNDNDRNTPLLVACEKGYVGVVKMLLENGADVEAKNRWEKTPLLHVCHTGNLNIGQLLIDHGVDTNTQDEHGVPALHKACENGHSGIAKLLIENGVNVETKGNSRETALHVACEKGHLRVVKTLLKKGANVAAKMASGDTPLDFACEGNHLELVWLLVSQYPEFIVG